MENPTQNIRLKSLGKNGKLAGKKIASVTLLGSGEKISWTQNNDALVIKKPAKLPDYSVVAFKIAFKK